MLTDTAGQEEYRGLWATSNLRCDAFLLVYDITNADSLTGLEHFIDLIDMETERRLDAGGVGPVKIVVGNKCDLQDRRQVKSQQGLEWARRHHCGFMETSAREMVNIEETFARESLLLVAFPSFADILVSIPKLTWVFSPRPTSHRGPSTALPRRNRGLHVC